MSQLTIELLGGLTIKLDNQYLTGFKSRKSGALLAYLAYQKRPFSRKNLAQIFWGESDASQAAANLRKTLSDLRKHVGEHLLITRQEVGINPEAKVWLDVTTFSQAVGSGRNGCRESNLSASTQQTLEEAIALYRGDFLAGFFLRDSLAFDEWASLERERLRLCAIRILGQLVHTYLHQRQYQAGINHAAHWLALDELNELAHLQMMRLQARRGQLNAALAQYQTCCHVLEAELGVTPTAKTQHTAARIQAMGQRAPTLPSELTSFVGRDEELAQLSQQLERENGSFLTIIGLGGVGKTRLALQLAATCQSDFYDGVCFVPLAGTTSDFLITTIISQLGLAVSEQTSTRQQVCDYLGQKEMLLVLDNFEHVCAAASLVEEMIQAAPHVKIIVTSRQPLAQPSEHLFTLAGLSLSEAKTQLFAERAVPGQPNFALTPVNRADIVRICDLVGGLPLGIELAAAATRAFTPSQIATQIQESSDFLETRSRGLPPRQRNMRAVFDYSWQLLSASEQNVLSKLSVFLSSFTLEAAFAVADASRAMLQALKQKSILMEGENGRFSQHPLLHQFGQEKLQACAADDVAAQAAHTRFYAQLLRGQTSRLIGSEQQSAIKLMQAELENVQTAWQRAATAGDPVLLQQMAEALYYFEEWNGRYQEGYYQFQCAIDNLDTTNAQHQPVLADCLLYQADLTRCLAEYDLAQQRAMRGLSLAVSCGYVAGEVQARICLGQVAYHQGDYAAAEQAYRQSLSLCSQLKGENHEAKIWFLLGKLHLRCSQAETAQACFQKSLTLQQEQGNQKGISQALSGLASIAHMWTGDFELAEKLFQENLVIRKSLGDLSGIGIDYNLLGNLACDREAYVQAITYYEKSLSIRREIGAKLGIASTLGNLATVYHLLAQYDQAEAYYSESLAISQAIQDQLGIAFCLMNLAELAYDQGHYEMAHKQVHEVLAFSLSLGEVDRLLYGLTCYAALLVEKKSPMYAPETGADILQYVFDHTQCDQPTQARVQDLLPELEPGRVTPLSDQTVEAIVAQILAEEL